MYYVILLATLLGFYKLSEVRSQHKNEISIEISEDQMKGFSKLLASHDEESNSFIRNNLKSIIHDRDNKSFKISIELRK